MKYPLSLAVVFAALLGMPAQSGATDRVDVLLEQVSRLQPAEQQRFLYWVELRLNRANEIVVTREEASAARAALHAKLRREPITWPGLRQLIGEMDRRESQAVEQLTRHYRVLSHQTFQNARDTYNRRQQAWFDAYEAWQSAGRPLVEQYELLDWLVRGIHSSTPGSVAELPGPLRFNMRSLASLLPPEIGPVVAVQPATPGASTTPQPSESESPALAAGPLPAATTPAMPRAEEPPVARLEPQLLAIAKEAVSFGGLEGGRTLPESAATALVSAAVWGEAASGPAVRRVEEPRLSEILDRTLARATAAATVAVDFHAASVPAEPETGHSETGHSEMPHSVGRERHARLASPARPVGHLSLLPRKHLLSDAAVLYEDDDLLVVALDRIQPGFESPEIPISIAQSAPRAVRDPILDETTADDVLPSDVEGDGASRRATGINLNELRSRIAGTNLALRAMESELYEPREWRPTELTPLVARLHTLALRVEDARLFRQMVPEDTRQLIDTADSPKPIVTLLAEQIAATRQRITGEAYSGTETKRQAELAQLDDLSRRLVEIVALFRQ